MPTKSYLCPICRIEQNRSKKRNVASQDCCTSCEYFVKATYRKYDLWFNSAAIEHRRKLNPRHPYINMALVQNIVKDSKLWGIFTTQEEIIIALRSIREQLYVRFDSEIRKYERYQLLTDTLNMLDNLYGERVFQHLDISELRYSNRERAERNIWINKYIGSVGKGLERILECTLSYTGFSKDLHTNQQSMFWILELASEIAAINQIIEDVVSLWHKGELRVDTNGWHWELQKDDLNLYHELITKWSLDDVRLEQQTYRNQEGGLTLEEYMDALMILNGLGRRKKILKHTKLDQDDEEFIIAINYEHQKYYGHKYSEKIMALLSLTGLPQKMDRDWIFEDEITIDLSEKLNLQSAESKSVIESLCLDGSLIRTENVQPFEFRRKHRLIRRPIPRILVGNRNAYYLSVPFLARSFMHIQAEYWDGSHPELEGTEIEKKIRVLNQRYADYFVRERILPIFRQNGFIAEPHVKRIGSINLEDECGEIDLLCFSSKRNILIIAECKHRVGKEIHVSQMRNEIEKFTKPKRGYVDVLKRKAIWIENHKEHVFGYLKVDNIPEQVKFIPIFITNYYCPASGFAKDIAFISEIELDSWCKNN